MSRVERCETSTAGLGMEASRQSLTSRSRSSTPTDERTSSPLRDVSRTGTSSEAGASQGTVLNGGRVGDASLRPTPSLAPPSNGARSAVRRKRLMPALNHRGRQTERQNHATRLVVDDFGDAVACEYRCQSCSLWSTSPKLCRDCGSWAQTIRLRANPEHVRAERRRRRKEAIERDPTAIEWENERHRLARAARMERDPERERELHRKRCERYRKRIAEDPQRYRAYLEGQRMSNTIRRQARGLATGNGHRRVDGTGGDHRHIAVAPLLYAVALFGDETTLAERSGVSDRMLRAWRTSERAVTRWNSADAVLVGLDRFWWEVFDPEDKPTGLFSSVRSRDVLGWVGAAERAVELWGDDES